MNLSTVKQFSANNKAFSESSIRALIFNADSNGLAESGAIVRIGGRVLIIDEKFFSWVEVQNKVGAK